MLSAPMIDKLRTLTSFPRLIAFLRDELQWPLELDSAADPDDLVFDYDPVELGIDPKFGAKIKAIRQFRPLAAGQKWGIFWIEFETQRLPVMVLRRVLTALVNKRRREDRPSWAQDDLLFISVQGADSDRGIAFSHFAEDELQTFSWDARENHFFYLKNLHLDRLTWPRDPRNAAAWRDQWRRAFTVKHQYTVQTSRMLAIELAKCAITIRELVSDLYDVENDNGAMHRLLTVFQLDLLNGLNARDFADMIAQTVSYGLFSAAATIGKSHIDLTIDTLAAAIPKTNPFLHDLFGQLTAQDGLSLDELGVSQLIDLLNSVDMADILQDFGRQTGSGREDPVIHFYEDFLSQYDRAKKVERGVFYTPDPVVEYMVRAVDDLLKSEFGLSDGLASADKHPTTGEPLVQILDPATGTGTFLAHIIDHIAATVKTQRGVDWNAYVRDSLLPRLNGFELMMAPYTIAHTKLGLKLQQTGYDLSANNQRLRVFLTNALEPGILSGEKLGDAQFLEREAAQAGSVKRNKPIMVVIGNPPYSGTSQNNGKYISDLIRDYYFVDGQPLGERNPKWLQDDYVKFIRFGQERIAQNGEGILAFITNHGYLDNPTFRGMRQQLMQTFDDIFIIDLHGNSKRKERTPDGDKDENVFDIQQGVAIGIFIKRTNTTAELKETARVYHQNLWGSREAKYYALVKSEMNGAIELSPQAPFYLFIRQDISQRSEYHAYLALPTISNINNVGIVTGQDSKTIAFSHYVAEELARKFGLEKSCIRPISYRPFDARFVIYDERVITRPRSKLMRNLLKDNIAIITARQQSQNTIWSLVGVTDKIAESTVISGNTREINYVFPLYLYPSESDREMFDPIEWPISEKGRRPNLSREFVQATERALGLSFITDGTGDLLSTFGPEDIFHYAYAVFHSPTYRARYAEFLKIDFPRLPLTTDLDLFRELAARGAELVRWHLMEDMPTIPQDESDPFAIHSPQASLGAAFDPPPLPMQALYAGQADRPAYPRFVRGANGTTVGTMRESEAYEEGRVYLDSKLKVKGSYFEGVPAEVWAFRIGGYQVCHKWLYDRRGSNGEPGRTLTDEDIAHYQGIVVALRETIRLMGEIDAVIEDHGGWPLSGSGSPVVETELQIPIQDTQKEDTMSDNDIAATPEVIEDEPLTIEDDQAALDAAVGLEYEAEDDKSILPGTFDPRLIRMTTQTLSLDILLNRIRDNRIDLQPKFQRMAGVWDVRKKSRLIESLLIKIPLPSFYVDASNDEKWLIIDGLQRLTALREFVIEKGDERLTLHGLEFLSQEEGKNFDQLERTLQRRIEETQVTVYMVQEGTPPEVKYNIFKRINTGGSPLSAQEIRNALYQGKATQLLYDLTQNHEFQIATGHALKPIRMADREVVLRFLAFTLNPLSNYTNNDVDKLMNDTMLKINRMSDAEVNDLQIRFKRAMQAAFDVLDRYAFRKIISVHGKPSRRGTVNRALFDAWSVNLDQLSDEQIHTLKRRQKTLIQKLERLMKDTEFNASITFGTGDPTRVNKRFNETKRIINEVLNA